MTDLGDTVKAAFQKVAKGIAVLTLTSTMSGCVGFYAYARIDTPAPESGHARPPPTVLLPAVHSPPPMPYGECHTFAASDADSRDPNGHRITVCTCYPTSNPHDGYPCEIVLE